MTQDRGLEKSGNEYLFRVDEKGRDDEEDEDDVEDNDDGREAGFRPTAYAMLRERERERRVSGPRGE